LFRQIRKTSKNMPRVYLKPGRERPVLNGHPWIFSGAIDQMDGPSDTAGTADVFDCRKHWLARGLFNPASQIRVRVLTWKDEPVDGDFFARRISRALALRENFLSRVTSAYRLINGEGDLLPGLIVDRYADYFVCQFYTAGMESFKEEIVAALSPRPVAKPDRSR
jgi:23S rRNA (cytosine1962-C5)-methyltransferase